MLEDRVTPRVLVWVYFTFLVGVAIATVSLLGAVLLHYLPHNYLNRLGLDCAPSSGCATLPMWLDYTVALLAAAALLGLVVSLVYALVNGLAGGLRLNARVAHAARPMVDLIPARLRPVTCIVDDPAPLSYTLGGPHRRIIVSKGTFEALDADEIGAVLAHEEAHLLSHDGFLILLGQAVAFSMAVVPGVRLAFARMRHAQERAADEHASSVVGDPLVVASSLQKFSRSLIAPAASAPAFTQGGGVAERIQGLLRGGVSTTSVRRLALATLLCLSLLAVFSASAMAYTDVTRTSGRPCSACGHSSTHAVATQHPSPHLDCAVSH